MIASLFSKSKPINFVVVLFITLLSFTVARIPLFNQPMTVALIFKQSLVFLLCCITILVVNFIISKNNLTKKNNYDVLLYSVFLLTFVQTTDDVNILFANFFFLLGLRRIMSLRTEKSIKKKLFDAAFWIAIASLFYFWAILFFVLIIVSLLLYSDNDLRHWIIPYTGVATVFILSVCTSIVVTGDYFDLLHINPQIGADFTAYNSVKYLVGITMLLSFGIWASMFYLKNLKSKKKSFRASFQIIIIAFLVAALVIAMAPNKTGSEFLFAFAPLAIIITNYLETIDENWFKEVFLSILVVVPFIMLLL
ncbi:MULTISPECIES: DUF6427 family protein [Aestuariibaculum]|uniref:DUF6427 family protein n=1 Tax=Aestuariibaculum lutulentum TaxID=2920935 RepID=A0ABS9RGM3_9FLAO|nr:MULTISPECIES: DUF6427 family protein [Aestuariibaculum]MCH4552095.1 DUF6427 family protein [Aestuariibaculum lutulentum]MCR8667190.1 DUF6427 family protein [Aestuariibaculum sp. M13]